jgi:hypothetical protein
MKAMITSTHLESQKRRINKKFLGFLKRTFKDLVEIGDELTLLKQEMNPTEFREYLGEEFGGSKYLAQTAIAISSWFNGLSERLKTHILNAKSIKTLSNWSLAALRELPKVGEETVRSLLKFGAVSVKKIRAAAGASSTKTLKPTPGAEVLETSLQEAWEKLHILEVELDSADSDPASKETARLAIEVANKDFARIAGKLGISVGEALRRVKGGAVITEEEINQRIKTAIAQKRAEVEEALTQTKAQADREIRLMQERYAEENERLKTQLQQAQELLREKDLYKQRVAQLERELQKAQQVEDVVQERIAPVLEELNELKQERDRLLLQLEAKNQPAPQTISEEEWIKLKNRGVSAGLTSKEFNQLVLSPYGHERGRDLLASQLEEAWGRLEAYIEKEKKLLPSAPPKKGMTLINSRKEAEAYGQKMYGPGSERAAVVAEVQTLKVYQPENHQLLTFWQAEAAKYNLKLRDLVAEPFSFCICSQDQQKILAKISLGIATKEPQFQQVIDGQMGRVMPISSLSELLASLEESQYQQVEIF